MKIAVTYNVNPTVSAQEAEIDSKQTVSIICTAIEELGHQVEPIEVSGSISQTIARLEALSPDLIFNMAEGKTGPYKEAFFPGIFEQLGIPFTGSNAFACALAKDKNITKMILEKKGILSPKSLLITKISQIREIAFLYPVVMRSNFEGNSKCNNENSIAMSFEELKAKIFQTLPSCPNGIMIEEYIEGKDIAVQFLSGVSPLTKGVLQPIEYVFSEDIKNKNDFNLNKYERKNISADQIEIVVAAHVENKTKQKLFQHSQIIFETLGISDFGQINFKVTPSGQIYFINLNSLPALDPCEGLYFSAKQVGLADEKEVVKAIIKSAMRRFKITNFSKAKSKAIKTIRVGFAYNEKRIRPNTDSSTDMEAEFDSPETLKSIREAIRSHGHEVIDLEATPDFPEKLASSNVDIVFNIAEGLKGRSRESQVPAILELMNIPFTGSDAATLTLSHDKALAKRIVHEKGVPTPKFCIFETGKEKLPAGLEFPLMVKPVAEGSSKGVLETSVVNNDNELREIVKDVVSRYNQSALIEEYLPGREFTVAILGEKRPKVLPIMEIVFCDQKDKTPVYSYVDKLAYNDKIKYQVPADISNNLKYALESVAKRSFVALGCRDVARIDLRLDRKGNVHFLECNPLPGLCPGWSDLCLISESMGMEYRALIGEILAPALRRYKEQKKSMLKLKQDSIVLNFNKISDSYFKTKQA